MKNLEKFNLLNDFFQFTVRRSTVYSGIGSAKAIPMLLEGLGGKRVVMFTDKGIVKAGIVNKIKEFFDKDAKEIELVGIFDDIKPDARLKDIIKCVEYVKKMNADSLLAVGGGSVMDSVKMVKWLMFNEGQDVYKYFGEETLIIEKFPLVKSIPIPHLAIPTTAGTGTEISTTSVVYNEKSRLKSALMNPNIGADIAVLDAEMTASLPARLTAETGYDAFTHAFEAFFSPTANCLSDAHAKEAIQVLVEYLPKACQNGSDLNAREKVLLGNIMAISAFGLVKNRTPIHNIAVALGNVYHVPHGLANAVSMGPTVEFLPDVYAKRCEEFAKLVGIKKYFDNGYEAHEEVVKWINNFRGKLNIGENLENLCLDEDEVKCMVQEIYKAPSARYYKIEEYVAEKIIKKIIKKI